MAMTRISGRTPLYSEAKYLPVRPNPLCTSSTMSRIPCVSHTARRPSRNSVGAGTYPPSPRTGSMMMAAVSRGEVCCVSRRSSWKRDCVTREEVDADGGTPCWCQKGYGMVNTPGWKGVCQLKGKNARWKTEDHKRGDAIGVDGFALRYGHGAKGSAMVGA